MAPLIKLESPFNRHHAHARVATRQTLREWLAARERSRIEILALFCDAGRQLAHAHALELACGFSLDSVHVIGGRRAQLPERRQVRPCARLVRTWPRPETDQLEFCAALWEALYGASPFPRLGRAPRAPEGGYIPSWLHAALVRGMSQSPRLRFPSIHALLDALSRPNRTRRAFERPTG